jgi:hypothetical protein
MKKMIVGALVGGLLIFIWQFLSWTILDLHRPAYQHTPKQDSILQYLSTQFSTDGQYMLPSCPAGATHEQMETAMKAAEGKPRAIVDYHSVAKSDMTAGIVRGLVSTIVMVGLLCWILLLIPAPSFGTIFLATLFTGLIVFINAPYTMFIWFETPGIMAHLKDAIASWGLCGIWLGWYFRKK